MPGLSSSESGPLWPVAVRYASEFPWNTSAIPRQFNCCALVLMRERVHGSYLSIELEFLMQGGGQRLREIPMDRDR